MSKDAGDGVASSAEGLILRIEAAEARAAGFAAASTTVADGDDQPSLNSSSSLNPAARRASRLNGPRSRGAPCRAASSA